MVVPALSLSISHASFQAELEGAILQQTASVDFYLQTAAPKWSADSYGQEGSPPGLRSLFLSDLQNGPWQPLAFSQEQQSDEGCAAPVWPAQHRVKRRSRAQPLQADGAASQLEQFLQDDLQRFMELREQLADQASASDAAVLASTTAEHQRRLSSSSSTNSGISFVRLPDESLHDAADEEEEAHHPVAAALAAAAAAAVVGDLAASPSRAAVALRMQADLLLAAQPSPAAPTASTTVAAAQPAESGESQQGGSSRHGADHTAAEPAMSAEAAAAARAQFVMQPDEEVDAQKRAARARLAELEQDSTAAAEVPELSAEATASTCKGFQKWAPDSTDAHTADVGGSMHSSKVPERPRGLAPMPAGRGLGPDKPLLSKLASRLYELSMVNADGVLLQHNQFLQHMLVGLVLCVVLLPVLWLLQSDGSRGPGIVRNLLPAALTAKAEQLSNVLYGCSAMGVLLYCLVRSLVLQPPLLHFRDPALELQYLLWSNAGRLFQDCLFQLTFLVVGSCLWLRLLQGGAAGEAGAAVPSGGHLVLSALTLVGSGLPVIMLVLLRSPRYVEWREPLLGGSRLCSVLALSVMQLAAGPAGQLQLNMPFIALAQVMSIACMQVRLSSFVPLQVLHLLVLLLCTRALNPLLQFTQLFGGWLCLPCLVLYSMEMHSRKAFLATCSKSTA